MCSDVYCTGALLRLLEIPDLCSEYTDDDTASNEDVVIEAAAAADVEEGIDDLYCVACNRAFKTPKA